MSNIHGVCPYCNADMDGELVMDFPRSQGCDENESRQYACHYSGWSEHGEANRWGRRIGIYSIGKDRTMKWQCPDCKQQWER